MDYNSFLESKKLLAPATGFEVNPSELNPNLFPFQRDLTAWALNKGRAAIFADTGLGKSIMELAWAEMIAKRTGGQVLILTHLTVAQQMIREAAKFGFTAHYARSQDGVQSAITITNYEMLDKFDVSQFIGVVLDESSILKSYDSKTRLKLIEAFQATPYRLCGTATPAPNDIAEIANHAEFLGVISRREMFSAFFINTCETFKRADGSKVRTAKSSWRLKNWAKAGPFWKWLASWSMSVRKPSDLGDQYSDDGYILPKLNVMPEFLKSNYVPADRLFFTELKGIQERNQVRKATIEIRAKRVAEIAKSKPDEQFLVWVDTNEEDDYIAALISGTPILQGIDRHKYLPSFMVPNFKPDVVVVEGSDSPEFKAETLTRFASGEIRVLVSKTSIAGFGLNLQNCHNMIFCGLNDSWESFYQAIRRCWRFGQTEQVNVWLVMADVQEPIYQNIMRKEKEAQELSTQLVKYVKEFEQAELGKNILKEFNYMERNEIGKEWRLMLGDSTERLKEIETASVGLSIFSPPFSALYVYSNSERDLGNSKNLAQFMLHFRFIARELRRVMMPGRVVCMHLQDIQATNVTHGERQCIDLSGTIIKMFQKVGFLYQGRFTINKNPQTQAARNKIKELLFVTMRKDRAELRPTYPDYVLIFKAPGENPMPVAGGFSEEEWIRDAHPCWTDIRETNVLNVSVARNDQDERHLCPLQLDVIERCIKLYSNAGDVVLSPFAGIGSEVYMAVKMGRRGLGIELKPEYFEVCVRNVREAERLSQQEDLFTISGIAV